MLIQPTNSDKDGRTNGGDAGDDLKQPVGFDKKWKHEADGKDREQKKSKPKNDD